MLPKEWAAVVLELKNRPRPKSPSFTTAFAVTKTLAGLMSEGGRRGREGGREEREGGGREGGREGEEGGRREGGREGGGRERRREGREGRGRQGRREGERDVKSGVWLEGGGAHSPLCMTRLECM